MQAPNLFLGQCLSAKVENPIVRHNQLPERQEKSLSRHGILIQLMACQIRRIRTKKAILALVPFDYNTEVDSAAG